MIDFCYRVRLQSLDRAMAMRVRHWRNNPAIRGWCRQRFLISDFDQENWYEAMSRDSSIKMYLIEDENKEPSGVCGLTGMDPWNRRAEFSCYIIPEKRKRGLAARALQTLFVEPR